MEIYAFMYHNMKCPNCGSELDTGFNCPKCKAKIYKETVSNVSILSLPKQRCIVYEQ